MVSLEHLNALKVAVAILIGGLGLKNGKDGVAITEMRRQSVEQTFGKTAQVQWWMC